MTTDLNKLFMEGDSPNLPDHDVRSGQTVVPNGYMFLTFKDNTCMDFRPTLSAKKMSEPTEGFRGSFEKI